MSPSPARRSHLDELINTSLNSQLISYRFESKSLRFQLFHASAGLLEFVVVTDTVHGRSVPADPRGSRCRIAVTDLQPHLTTRDGRYLPPTDPDMFLKHVRDRMTLAYGRRAAEYRWLLVLKGAYPLLACLVRDLSEIDWITE